jgi:hypothetical protein
MSRVFVAVAITGSVPPMRTSSLAIVISAVLAATAAYSQSADTSVLKLPQDIEFKAAPVPGAPQTAVLYGDPTKPGVYS